jgi:hypothetical protein
MLAVRGPSQILVGMTVGLLLAVASCSALSAGDGETFDEDSTGVAVAALSGVAIDVSNAVSPFDHESGVDSFLLSSALTRHRPDERQFLSDCLAAEGFTLWLAKGPLPARDDPMLISNWHFPQVDALASEGFVQLPGTPGKPEDFQGRPPKQDAAEQACIAAMEDQFRDSDRTRALELYWSMRIPWGDVLDEIDDSAEVRDLVQGFSACLADEGVPVESAIDELHFLSYVDELLWRADDVAATEAEIHVRLGKLYVECGRELFETKEQLRSGERRTAFLAEHAETVRELSDLLSSLGLEG